MTPRRPDCCNKLVWQSVKGSTPRLFSLSRFRRKVAGERALLERYPFIPPKASNNPYIGPKKQKSTQYYSGKKQSHPNKNTTKRSHSATKGMPSVRRAKEWEKNKTERATEMTPLPCRSLLLPCLDSITAASACGSFGRTKEQLSSSQPLPTRRKGCGGVEKDEPSTEGMEKLAA